MSEYIDVCMYEYIVGLYYSCMYASMEKRNDDGMHPFHDSYALFFQC